MMNKARIAVFVSGGGTNLQALIDAQNSGIIKSGKINLVISNNPDAFALKRANSANIKTCVCNKKELGADFENTLIRVLEENQTDIIVLAGFMCILSEKTNKKLCENCIFYKKISFLYILPHPVLSLGTLKVQLHKCL